MEYFIWAKKSANTSQSDWDEFLNIADNYLDRGAREYVILSKNKQEFIWLGKLRKDSYDYIRNRLLQDEINYKIAIMTYEMKKDIIK
jgi:hypothetical protein